MTQPKRIELTSKLQWVRLDQMKISPLAQRKLNQAWADELTKRFDPDLMGMLHASYRDGWYWVVDGQHRREGAIGFLGSDQQVQCHVYTGLTIQQEAELFLALNSTKTQSAMSKYQVALTAGPGDRPVESDVDRITRALGLTVGPNANGGEITCVTALINTYKKNGPGSLSFALRVIRDAYAYDGFKAAIIGGLALVYDRYGDQLDEETLVQRLAGGTLPIVHRQGKALRESLGRSADQCYAAALVDAYNSRAKGRAHRLAEWFPNR